jgi:hypothetical protein
MVMVSDAIVHTSVVVEVTVGVSPEVAVGETVKVDADHKRSASESKATVFDA